VRNRPSLVAVVNQFPAASETFIVRKLEALRERGLAITVVARDLRPTADPVASSFSVVPTILGGGTTTERLGRLAHALKATGAMATAARRRPVALRPLLLAAPILRLRPDIVHFEFSGIGVSYLDAIPLLRPARIVISCRGAAEQITPHCRPERMAQLRRLFAAADLIHCVSTDMAGTVSALGAPPDKIFVNRPAVDVNRYRPAVPLSPTGAGAPLRLTSVGRLHWKKGFDVAIEAVRRVVAEGTDVRYRIAGEGDEREKLQFMIADAGLADHVELLGQVPQSHVDELLSDTDIFMLPSLSEGLSNSALEAMASALPVIATSAGGMGEAITDGIDGLLVAPAAPEALAPAVLSLGASPNRRRQLGQAARRRIADAFSLERQAAAFEAAYLDLLPTGHGPERRPKPGIRATNEIGTSLAG
jgi:colanic acid/amylovoran biosynthesis glycosyltransferase